MSYQVPLLRGIDLHVKDRISGDDARRQAETAREILRRLKRQPGLVLADEVGMGKTFVALAVAASVALTDKRRRPVVVMVPPSLQNKWPNDAKLFREKCLPPNLARRFRFASASRAVGFLKLLDDPAPRRKSLIFLTHGAMSRSLGDHWVKLALIHQALKGRWGSDTIRRAVARHLGDLLWIKWLVNRVARKHDPETFFFDMLQTPPANWLDFLQRREVDPEMDDDPETDDDPVPQAVCQALGRIDSGPLREALTLVPQRSSKNLESRLAEARKGIQDANRGLWSVCLREMNYRSPLLVLDEAHHLKNAATRLASLFQTPESRDDAEEFSRGPLAGVFERMLFLTATPFQLGHAELCSVLERFNGICWTNRHRPACDRQGFQQELAALRSALDATQTESLRLDAAWGRLSAEDLPEDPPWDDADGVSYWWKRAEALPDPTPAFGYALQCYRRTRESMQAAERLLRPWVVRHLRPRELPGDQPVPRRRKLPGDALRDEGAGDGDDSVHQGLSLEGGDLLPFLLAARTAALNPEKRPVFAEGLASSYEAFLHTRLQNRERWVDEDADPTGMEVPEGPADWYLARLQELVGEGRHQEELDHPKVRATTERALALWGEGEKVLVFCHYVATGRVLRQQISEALAGRIRQAGREKLGCPLGEVDTLLERLGNRFFDPDSPVRRACDREAGLLIEEFPVLGPARENLLDIMRRNLRTPCCLVRFFPLRVEGRYEEVDVETALAAHDRSGISLREMLHDFLNFLAERCGEEERQDYLEALDRIQTGSHTALGVEQSFDLDEREQARGELLPNVRLVNGSTRQDTRQRLMLAFNTPFYPEILVASSVMAEGVDLHLNCRHVIHHDLCWNPSTLEQRTGRIDRIGAKVERCRRPIHVYLPYIAETQDEKQYRVVSDRERWFNVLMGESYQVDYQSTERLARRLPFPEAAAHELMLNLQVGAAKES